MRPLPVQFYRRHVLDVARDLLGRVLCTHVDGTLVRARITETEAYHHAERGAHCFGGKRTKRTRVMFEPGGITYVFFVYGMHWQFNVVTGPADDGQAVLIRGVEPLGDDDVLGVVRSRRGWTEGGRKPSRRVAASPRLWCDGPAKLCQGLAITGAHNGIAIDGSQGVWFEAGAPVDDADVAVGPRVGIDYAGDDAQLPWRFRVR